MSLYGYYELLFAISQNHKFSITELEDMIPYERDVYTQMIRSKVEEQKEKAKGYI